MENLCDCFGCRNLSNWKQSFYAYKQKVIVYLCNEHHFILRTKVKGNVKLDENVLTWLYKQPANSNKVVKYGIFVIGSRVVGS